MCLIGAKWENLQSDLQRKLALTFLKVHSQSDVHVWDEFTVTNTQLTLPGRRSLCLLCAQFDASVCLICKTAKSKIMITVHPSPVKSIQTHLTITTN